MSFYTAPFTSGKLSHSFLDIDDRTEDRPERLREQMPKLNRILVCARKILEEALIFAHVKSGREKSLPQIF